MATMSVTFEAMINASDRTPTVKSKLTTEIRTIMTKVLNTNDCMEMFTDFEVTYNAIAAHKGNNPKTINNTFKAIKMFITHCLTEEQQRSIQDTRFQNYTKYTKARFNHQDDTDDGASDISEMQETIEPTQANPLPNDNQPTEQPTQLAIANLEIIRLRTSLTNLEKQVALHAMAAEKYKKDMTLTIESLQNRLDQTNEFMRALALSVKNNDPLFVHMMSLITK
jgi:hypothetical protein